MSSPAKLQQIIPRVVDTSRFPEVPGNTPFSRAAIGEGVSIREPDGSLQPIMLQRHVPPTIPRRFVGASFDTFRPTTASQRAALRAVGQFVLDAIAGNGTMLALIGTQGAGKSHLLYAAARALIEADQKVYSRPWYTLADELRYGGVSPFNTSMRFEPAGIRDMLWTHRIVLLDEVRPTAGTAFDDTELAKFSCHAWDDECAVLITSNVNPLAEVMGAPAASRYVQLMIDGPDRRQTP